MKTSKFVVGFVVASFVILSVRNVPADGLTGGLTATLHCSYPHQPAISTQAIIPCAGTGSVTFSGIDSKGHAFTAFCTNCTVEATLSIFLQFCIVVPLDSVEQGILSLKMYDLNVVKRNPSGLVSSHATIEVSTLETRTGGVVLYETGSAIGLPSTLTYDDPDEGGASDLFGGGGVGDWIPDSPATPCRPLEPAYGVTLSVNVASLA